MSPCGLTCPSRRGAVGPPKRPQLSHQDDGDPSTHSKKVVVRSKRAILTFFLWEQFIWQMKQMEQSNKFQTSVCTWSSCWNSRLPLSFSASEGLGGGPGEVHLTSALLSSAQGLSWPLFWKHCTPQWFLTSDPHDRTTWEGLKKNTLYKVRTPTPRFEFKLSWVGLRYQYFLNGSQVILPGSQGWEHLHCL